MTDMSGSVALVTGGANSLGAGIVRAFFSAGASVVIADIDSGAGQALAATLMATAVTGQGAKFFQTDITDDAQLQALVDGISQTFGRLDFLVNNACVYADAGLASSRAQWLASLNVNLVSGALLVQSARPLLAASPNASIVNLSSIAGKIAQRGRALYPACKAALFQLTRSEAIDLAADGIRVNAVSPAWTWGDAMARQVKGDRPFANRVARRLHPAGRVGEIEDVASAVMFLCAPSSKFITGIDLPVDGGYSMLGPDQGHGPAQWFDEARRGSVPELPGL